MRQCRWIELLSDYDCVICYHPGKANVVADALSRKDKEPIRVHALVVTVHKNLPEQSRNAHVEACKEENIGAEGFHGEGEPFEVRIDGTKCLKGRVWLPLLEGLRGLIMHGVPVLIISDRYPRFASRFWRSLQKSLGTNLDMSTAYHPETDGQSERAIQTLEDMLRACMIDFGSDWISSYLWLNSHTIIVITLVFKPHLSKLYTEESVDRLYVGVRQKSYADVRRKPLEFKVGDKVMLKVSPWKGVVRFGKRGKLSPCFIGPFKILSRVVRIDEKLHFIEEPVEIMDREVKQLKQSRILLVKVRLELGRGPGVLRLGMGGPDVAEIPTSL
ncbi:putative reverse transcriptase domain-containing protein [Tanacetum coccineum]